MSASRLVSLSRKIIKPSSPTPLSHRIHKLSLMDQMGTHSYMAALLFYPKQNTTTSMTEPTKISQVLEKSLSKVLTSYYPFAGQVRDNSFVECNDIGAYLSIVRIDCPMSSILDHPRTYIDNLVLPFDPWFPSTDSLVAAKLCHFECGGVALGVCLSHKVSDGCSLGKFLRDWSMVARDSEAKLSPLFNGSSIFKPSNSSSFQVVADPPLYKNESKRCVNTTPSLLIQAVDQRGTSNDALVPADLTGNAILPFVVSATNKEEMNWERLVSELRKGKEKIQDMLKYIESEEFLCSKVSDIARELNERTSNNDIPMYRFSSLRRFPSNDMNFGWGRPRQVDISTLPINMFILMDNQNGDGVEVIVSLEDGELSALERNDEFLQFASPCLGF
ncbi:hypothetical protein H5410_059636 [Solanum commersonii]|uniref:Acylsugar acyltransferase 3 n=1 Tax=Solanum commersonii TaxID=4109 RepID=A0A9J5W427_SOLCO|nr:hypothetical protein H5410_059636 [Solanum commersonii]